MAKPLMLSTARELYRSAVAMHEITRLAAPHIKPSNQSQSAVYLGYYFNLGFAVELYLKAFLRDQTEQDVTKYKHDLNKLLKAALEHGFDFERFAMSDIVKIIGHEHKTLRFRYAEGAKEFSYINQLNLVDATLEACRLGMVHLGKAIG